KSLSSLADNYGDSDMVIQIYQLAWHDLTGNTRASSSRRTLMNETKRTRDSFAASYSDRRSRTRLLSKAQNNFANFDNREVCDDYPAHLKGGSKLQFKRDSTFSEAIDLDLGESLALNFLANQVFYFYSSWLSPTYPFLHRRNLCP